jgi:uncharacterized protein (TIRG00374 family)
MGLPRLSTTLLYGALALMLGWCAYALRADLAQMSFEPVFEHKYAVLVATLLSLFNYLLRIVRWWIYMARLGFPLRFGYTALTYVAGFAFTLSPGKAGEMARAGYYRNLGVPITATGAAFVAERSLDLLAMLVLAALALAFSTAHTALILQGLALVLVGLAVLAFAPWNRWHAGLVRDSDRQSAWRRARNALIRTAAAAQVLLTPSLLAAGLALGLLAWGAEGVGLFVIAGMVPDHGLTWATAVGIYSVAIVAGAVSFLPGGLGGAEAVMIAMLVSAGVATSDAILITLMCRLLTWWLAVALGWLAVLVLRRRIEPAALQS